MKGLFLKDLYFTLQQKKMLLIILFMFIIFYISQGAESGPFVIAYVSLLGGMFVLNTISYDEYENSISYLFTLPIQRSEYVKEKYLFGVFGLSFFWGIVTLAYLCLNYQNAQETLLGALMILAVMFFFEMVMLPVQLKFGGDKGRIAVIGIVVAGMLLLFGIKSLLEGMAGSSEEVKLKLLNLTEGLLSMNPWIAGMIVGGILMVGAYISYRISLKVILNREY